MGSAALDTAFISGINNRRDQRWAWNDVWFQDEASAEQFPAIYSHCNRKDEMVSMAVQSNLADTFVPRLTVQASSELQQVLAIVETQGNDRRKSQFDCRHGKLDSSPIYKLLKAKQHPADTMPEFIWKNSALQEYNSLCG